jgi:hypothetical protein
VTLAGILDNMWRRMVLVVAGCTGAGSESSGTVPPLDDAVLQGSWQRIHADGTTGSWNPRTLSNLLVPPPSPPGTCDPCSSGLGVEDGFLAVTTSCVCTCPSPTCGHGDPSRERRSTRYYQSAIVGDLFVLNAGARVGDQRWEGFSATGRWSLELDGDRVAHEGIECAWSADTSWRAEALGIFLYSDSPYPNCGTGWASVFADRELTENPDVIGWPGFRRVD